MGASMRPHRRATSTPHARQHLRQPHGRGMPARPQRGQPGGLAAAVRRGRRHGRARRRRGGVGNRRERAWPSRHPAHPGCERARQRRASQRTAPCCGACTKACGREGMGTTCTAAMLEGERLVIAQVGDSRAYLLHQGKLQQLTRDHSLMADMIEAGQLTPEEARTHPQRSVITRALGSDPHAATRPVRDQRGNRRPPAAVLGRPVHHGAATRTSSPLMARTRDPQRCASQLVNAGHMPPEATTT